MSENFVIVTATWTNLGSPPTYGTGNFEFIASGQLMDSPSIAIVTPIIQGDIDSVGSLSLPGTTPGSGIALMASDNFGTGEFLWNVKVRVSPGFDIDMNGLEINFSDGPTQGLFGIIQAAGWTPPPGL